VLLISGNLTDVFAEQVRHYVQELEVGDQNKVQLEHVWLMMLAYFVKNFLVVESKEVLEGWEQCTWLEFFLQASVAFFHEGVSYFHRWFDFVDIFGTFFDICDAKGFGNPLDLFYLFLLHVYKEYEFESLMTFNLD